MGGRLESVITFNRASTAQWKALLLAYPLYSGTLDDVDTLRTELEYFCSTAVPMLRRVFHLPDTLDWKEEVEGEVTFDSWHRYLPAEVHTWLCHLFERRPADEGEGPKDTAKFDRLHPSERLLLRLCHKERQRVNQYFNLYRVVQGQLEFYRDEICPHHSSPIAHLPPTSTTPIVTKVNGELLPWSFQPLPPSTAGGTAAPSTSLPPPPPPVRVEEAAVAPAAPLEWICEGCLESGADMYRCSQCQGLRHEACGGPHPPDRQADRNAPVLLLCRACSRALQLTSSSSSSCRWRCCPQEEQPVRRESNNDL